jgi:hypothetical protein
MPIRSSSRAAIAAFLAIFPLAPLGCHSAPARPAAASADPVGRVPDDLAVELSVRVGFGLGERSRIEERTVRMVLLADGTLCAASDRVPDLGTRPPRVRRLGREQMAEVWSRLVSAGFSSEANAEARGNVALLEPANGEILATLELHAEGRRLVFARRYRPDDEREQAMRSLVRAVASLAWASDEMLVESAELPNRYDAGADPYARFAPKPTKPEGDAAKGGPQDGAK